jgi:hypothetical protein
VIAGVNDTGDKFIAIAVGTGKQLSLWPLIRVCEMSMDVPFRGGQ